MIGAIVFRISMILIVAAEYTLFAVYKDMLFWIYEQMKMPLSGLLLLVYRGETLLLGINVLTVLVTVFIGALAFKRKPKQQMICVAILVCVCTLLNMLAIGVIHMPLVLGDRFLSAG